MCAAAIQTKLSSESATERKVKLTAVCGEALSETD